MSHSAKSPRVTLYYGVGSVVALILLLMWMEGAFEHKVPPGISEARAEPHPALGHNVRVVKREADDIQSWPGTVAALSVTQVAAKLPGRILDIGVRAGDRVRAGQVIARLDDAELRARLGQARAMLAAADAEAVRARADAGRLQNLYNREAATRQDLEAALAAAKAGEAKVTAARDAIREVESRLADAVLRAPYDAIVVKRDREPGDMALPGSPVVTFQQSSRLRLESAVPANCAGRIHVGSEVGVRMANPEAEFRAAVDEIQPAADPETRTVLVKARLPEGSSVNPGAFGWLQQACGRSEVLILPDAAVSRIGQLERVRLVVDGQSRVRLVRTGKRYDGQLEIISGLKEGDTVVVPGAR